MKNAIASVITISCLTVFAINGGATSENKCVGDGNINISCDYPGGNVKVLGIDEKNNVVYIAPDLRGNKRRYFHFDFIIRGAAGRTLRFQFPADKYQYLAALGPAISRDGGNSWSWLRPDGTYHDPANAFDYIFGANENETRFAFSIPYTQKNWDEYSAKWRGVKGVKFDVLCKSQSGRRDTELLRVPCRGDAKWLFALTARHHACETSASAVMEGCIDELLSGGLEGEWLRNNADCVFVPFIDKDGVEDGEQGKHRAPHDHNRDYVEGLYTSIRAIKELLVRESKGKQIVFLDMHAPHSRATGKRRPSVHDTVFTFEPFGFPLQAARWQALRRNWAETSKGGALVYTGKTDIFSNMKGNNKRETLQSRNWVKELPNCWMSTCCEFGYSLCNGVYSRSAARELGRSLIKAMVRTMRNHGNEEAAADDLDVKLSSNSDVVIFDAAVQGGCFISSQDDAKVGVTNGLLNVSCGASKRYPGFSVSGRWDLSGCDCVEVELDRGLPENFRMSLMNEGGKPNGMQGSKLYILQGKGAGSSVLRADFLSYSDPTSITELAEHLRPLRTWSLAYAAGLPCDAFVSRRMKPNGLGNLDLHDVRQVALYLSKPEGSRSWSVRRIVAKKNPAMPTMAEPQPWTALTAPEFFPFIDKYGQFVHKNWPDKVHSDADFAVQREKEEKDIATHAGPKCWDKWGGWADGPQLPKTGNFSTTKWKGKWWIVDPDGHLWWSHGPVRVTPSSGMTPLATPSGDRRGWFVDLPAKDDPVLKVFYDTRDELLWPYYTKRGIDKVYDFSAANIRRKYGEKWFESWADLAHRRLRSWGCNTIANSSDKRICLMDRTPYTERYEIHARPIEGHKGGWWEFCDPFDPSFRSEARRMTEVYRAEFEDPWCIGFFVDNEHHWGKPHSFGLSTLKSPADQPCKAVFRDRLKAKYGTVEKLNAAWKTAYADWDAFMSETKEPKKLDGALGDLEAFSSEIADNYFRIIREELKRANPGKLYLGCRWAGTPPVFSVRAASKYCDIISYTVYRKDVSGFKLPKGVDMPILIGEFHFGALDRGPFCPGLILLRDQKERAKVYKEFVKSALLHPNFVGAHWHQFSDQATSGRFDGENMQVGWTDICDTPYWETVQAVREIGYEMYEIRSGALRTND